MSTNNINDKILSILSETYPNGLTYSEICGQTGSTKKTKSSVSQSLAAMLLGGELIKERKRYRLSKEPQRQEAEIPAKAKTPAKDRTPQKEQQQQRQC